MCIKIREIFWPKLEKLNAYELEELCHLKQSDIDNIQNTEWDSEIELALEEARRLLTEEDERRKTAESKASNLLLVAVALIPLLIYLETTISDGSPGTSPNWLTMFILAVAVAYLGCAGLWSFRTISVGTYHRVYPTDLVDVWNDKNGVKNLLTVKMMEAIRRNQEPINQKVSASEMTHAFLLRAIIAFSVLLLVRIGSELWYALKQPFLEFFSRIF